LAEKLALCLDHAENGRTDSVSSSGDDCPKEGLT
jgi:hypothetical protein